MACTGREITSAALLLLLSCAIGGAQGQQVCAGAEGRSLACCAPCSSCGANDGSGNNGSFDVGFGNQGFGNDGFNNVGDLNVGSANEGDCNLGSGAFGVPAGGCPPEIHDLLYRACLSHPTYSKCVNPPATYGAAAIAVIKNATSKCVAG